MDPDLFKEISFNPFKEEFLNCIILQPILANRDKEAEFARGVCNNVKLINCRRM